MGLSVDIWAGLLVERSCHLEAEPKVASSRPLKNWIPPTTPQVGPEVYPSPVESSDETQPQVTPSSGERP